MIKHHIPIRIFTFMSVGALGYGAMEVAARGFTHISMGLLGGICFCFIGFTGSLRRRGLLSLIQQMLVVTLFITTSELLCGLVTNLMLGMNVWDYSDVPLNYKGQICLPFAMLWFVISYFGIITDEWVLGHIFHEETRSSIFRRRIIKNDSPSESSVLIK